MKLLHLKQLRNFTEAHCQNDFENWIQFGDGSRFSQAHLEFSEIRELSKPSQMEALKIYAFQPFRFFFFFLN
jgi:hypothetical protein